MPWKWLNPDQWAAIGSVSSAVINVIVVVILVRYNKKTLDVMAKQAEEMSSQTRVANHTLAVLEKERRLQRSRQLIETIGRLHDLNDQLVIIGGELENLLLLSGPASLKPSNWEETLWLAIEFWPSQSENLYEIDSLIRRIDVNLRFIADFRQSGHDPAPGVALAKELVEEAHKLLLSSYAHMKTELS